MLLFNIIIGIVAFASFGSKKASLTPENQKRLRSIYRWSYWPVGILVAALVVYVVFSLATQGGGSDSIRLVMNVMLFIAGIIGLAGGLVGFFVALVKLIKLYGSTNSAVPPTPPSQPPPTQTPPPAPPAAPIAPPSTPIPPPGPGQPT